MNAVTFRQELESARRRLMETVDDDEARQWCVWIMQRAVTLAERIAGESSFAQRFPSQARSLAQARRLVEHPTAHVGKLLPFLKTFGRWLVKEAERQSGDSAQALPRWRRLQTS